MHFDKPNVVSQDIFEIAQLYDLGTVLQVEYLGGVPNVTYKVSGDKRSVALRVGNKGYTSPQHLELEIQLLDHLEKVGFAHSPRLVGTIDQRKVHLWQGYPVIATDYIDGITAEKLQISTTLCFDVGKVVADLERSLTSFRTPVPVTEALTNRIRAMIQSFPDNIKKLGWQVDSDIILRQWEEVENTFLRLSQGTIHNVTHTDIWPPNVICKKNKVEAIVDFDDWAYGPTIIDICAPLIEFPALKNEEMDPDFAMSILTGYFQNGGKNAMLEEKLLVSGMEMLCLSWLSCNAIHNVSFSESSIYLHKLDLLRDKDNRGALEKHLKELIRDSKMIKG